MTTRIRSALTTALVPLAACSLTLAGLTTWTASGAAGSPPRIEVGDSRVFLPYGGRTETAAFFRITNTGGSDDLLTAVTSPAVDRAMLSRHVNTDDGAGFMRMIDSADVPAGGTLTMSPSGVDVMVRTKGRWRVGDTIPFVLHFRDSGRVETVAAVIRPGS
ncbi:copper chaperone PCu(A)C [Streptomyces sp. NPDC020681]|uniref:copper chaperone PCu(A)C n=1 Tax=Streptomyces sp. NPDC020681 TaxID=3365083 RepID=UPI0037B0E666